LKVTIAIVFSIILFAFSLLTKVQSQLKVKTFRLSIVMKLLGYA